MIANTILSQEFPFTVPLSAESWENFFSIVVLISKLILAKKKIAHLQEIMLNLSLIQYYSRYFISIQNF